MAMNRRQFLSVLPAGLMLPGVTLSEPTHMHLGLWFSLSQETRDRWEKRLKRQWNVGLNHTREFWFDGDRITGVRVLKLNSEGRPYLNEARDSAVYEELGVVWR